MKIIVYLWNANNEQILADNLIKQGYEVVRFRKACRHYTRDMELAMEMIPYIHEQGAAAVVSFNYFPIISMICNTCQIPYYAWVYDCPHFTLYAKQISLPCNHIGIFDRAMVRQLEGYGVTTVYHAPLAADAGYFGEVLSRASEAERERYRCDVSFVGSLYTDEHNYYDVMFDGGKHMEQADSVDCVKHGESSENVAGRTNAEKVAVYDDMEVPKADLCNGMDAVVRQQCFDYRQDYLRQAVADGQVDLAALQSEMERLGLMLGEDYFAKPEDILMAAVLEKKVTVEERRRLLTELVRYITNPAMKKEANLSNDGLCNAHDRQGSTGQNGKNTDGQSSVGQNGQNIATQARGQYDFRLYTGSDTKALPELDACNHGRVDYHTQMPLVFAGSKINLNITLRSIHSGIPLRVLDIMACGGFVLTNWQPEIAECFAEGVEIVTFGSLEECLDKVRYYLEHEEERRRIAAAGQEKVREKFSYHENIGILENID